jgi:hypothetical protein
MLTVLLSRFTTIGLEQRISGASIRSRNIQTVPREDLQGTQSTTSHIVTSGQNRSTHQLILWLFNIQSLADQELEYTTFGKPMTTTYKYAESLLDKIAPLTAGPDGQTPKRTVYGMSARLSIILVDLLLG